MIIVRTRREGGGEGEGKAGSADRLSDTRSGAPRGKLGKEACGSARLIIVWDAHLAAASYVSFDDDDDLSPGAPLPSRVH